MGGTKKFRTQGGDKHFYIEGGGQTLYVGGGGAYDNVDEEINMSEASKLSAGGKIFRSH